MLFFIVNPLSGKGYGLTIWKKISENSRSFLEKEGFQLFFTEGRGNAKVIARKLTEDSPEEKKIVVIGGTGTLNEVVDGLNLDGDNISLAFLPVCKENDFVRGLDKMYKRPLTIETLLESKERKVDYGIVEGRTRHRRFVVGAGMGFDAAVMNELLAVRSDICPKEKRGKMEGEKGFLRFLCKRSGTLSYIYAFVKGLRMAKQCKGSIILDGEERMEFSHILFLSVHNHPYEGPYVLGKGASCEDGYLNLCLVSTKHKLRLLRIMIASLFGGHQYLPGVHCYRFKTAEIHMEVPLPIHVDGENVGKQKDISFSCCKRRLRIRI